MSKNTKERNKLKATVEKLLTPTRNPMYQHFIISLINNLEYICCCLLKQTKNKNMSRQEQTKAIYDHSQHKVKIIIVHKRVKSKCPDNTTT